MVFDKTLINSLSAQAEANPRLRQAFDLRTTPADQSLCILNVMEPGTVLPNHRHRGSTETITCLRGRCVQYLYDDNGMQIDAIYMQPGTDVVATSVEVRQWHRLESLESGTVIFESKDGAYEPLSEEDVLKV